MDIRTFRAKTMREAIALVRRELGPDAVILHSREIRRSSVAKMLYGTGVEVAASQEIPPGLRKRHQPVNRIEGNLPRPGMSAGRQPDLQQPDQRQQGQQPDQQQGSTQEPPAFESAYDSDNYNKDTSNDDEQPDDPQSLIYPLFAHLVDESGEPISADALGSSSDVTEPDSKAPQSLPPAIHQLRERLELSDLPAGLIDSLCKQAAHDFEEVEELELDITLEHAVQGLAQQLLIAEPIQLPKRANTDSTEDVSEETNSTGPYRVALVGPTGVGKTTTVAKLAAKLSVTEGYRVGLITLDSYRVGAVEQLKTYANLLGLPLEVVGSTEQISSALKKMGDLDLVLIDTDGQSPRNEASIEQMQELLDGLSVDEVHLVLAAGTTQRGMAETVRAFARLNPTKLLLTKLDETPSIGHIVKTSHDASLPISYFTDGQGVPEDLTVAKAEPLARMIIDS